LVLRTSGILYRTCYVCPAPWVQSAKKFPPAFEHYLGLSSTLGRVGFLPRNRWAIALEPKPVRECTVEPDLRLYISVAQAMLCSYDNENRYTSEYVHLACEKNTSRVRKSLSLQVPGLPAPQILPVLPRTHSKSTTRFTFTGFIGQTTGIGNFHGLAQTLISPPSPSFYSPISQKSTSTLHSNAP